MNAAFKHLEDRIRLGELTLAQWGWLTFGVLCALAWGLYISPFGALLTLFTAIYVAGLPALAALFAGFTEFDFLGFARNSWRWWRSDGRFLPGGAGEPSGYVVRADDRAGARTAASPAPELEGLWAL